MAFEIFKYLFFFFVSLWFGNFITSFYFRIPRGISINGRKTPPMCSNCGIRLKYPDYGPLYYYLFKGKSCKSCGIAIPAKYFWIELLTGILLLTCFLVNGLSQEAMLKVLVILPIILIGLIYHEHGTIHEKSVWIFFLPSIFYKAIHTSSPDFALYEFVTTLTIGFVTAFLFEKIQNLTIKTELSMNEFCFFAGLSIVILSPIAYIAVVFAMSACKIVFFHKNTISSYVFLLPITAIILQ